MKFFEHNEINDALLEFVFVTHTVQLSRKIIRYIIINRWRWRQVGNSLASGIRQISSWPGKIAAGRMICIVDLVMPKIIHFEVCSCAEGATWRFHFSDKSTSGSI